MNPDKINAINNMGSIHNLKGVQRVTGCLASLSHFISRIGERGLPPIPTPKKERSFCLDERGPTSPGWAEVTIDYSTDPRAPAEEEPLLLYVAATTQVVVGVSYALIE